MTDYYFGQGDRLPQLKMVLGDQNGPIDLTDAESVKVYVEFSSGVKVYEMVVAPDQVTYKGHIQYDLKSDDIPDAGRFRMRTEVMWPGNRPETFPNDGYDYLNAVQRFV